MKSSPGLSHRIISENVFKSLKIVIGTFSTSLVTFLASSWYPEITKNCTIAYQRFQVNTLAKFSTTNWELKLVTICFREILLNCIIFILLLLTWTLTFSKIRFNNNRYRYCNFKNQYDNFWDWDCLCSQSFPCLILLIWAPSLTWKY